MAPMPNKESLMRVELIAHGQFELLTGKPLSAFRTSCGPEEKEQWHATE